MSIEPKKLGKKPRLICRDCGVPIGKKNIQRLCLECRKKRRLKPELEFEPLVKVVVIDGKKVLLGGLQHKNEGLKTT